MRALALFAFRLAVVVTAFAWVAGVVIVGAAVLILGLSGR